MNKTKHYGPTWDQASFLDLKEFWEAGKSATWIAAVLTQNHKRIFTKNVIIGKVAREGLRTGRVDLWTQARIDILSSMWIEGKSAIEIAGFIGHGVTRSAVIGKVKRLKLHRSKEAVGAAYARC